MGSEFKRIPNSSVTPTTSISAATIRIQSFFRSETFDFRKRLEKHLKRKWFNQCVTKPYDFVDIKNPHVSRMNGLAPKKLQQKCIRFIFLCVESVYRTFLTKIIQLRVFVSVYRTTKSRKLLKTKLYAQSIRQSQKCYCKSRKNFLTKL